MRSFIFSIVILFTSATSFAQPIAGDWYGALDLPKAKIHLVFHITKNGNRYSTTMDSPDQGAAGLNTDTTYLDNYKNLTIELRSLKIKYVASYDTAKKLLTGIFQQNGVSIPLVLKRTKDETITVPRPQDPTTFPYIQEDVTFKNTKDTITLAGTLTLPKSAKAKKIVILITGSGAQNRNEELKPFNHRPFLVLSDYLTRNGIAVLRYDDRGVGESKGVFSTATSADFAQDAQAAVDYIMSRTDLKDMQIGLIGHSEGGMIAPMIASKDDRIKFIVLLAGPGVPINELMFKQTENSMIIEDRPNVIIDLNLKTMRLVYTYLKNHPEETTTQMDASLRSLLKVQLAKYPNGALQNISVDSLITSQISSLLTPWFRYFIAYVPADYLSKVKCPVLALNGTLDKQVDADQNLPGIEAALKKGNNTNYKVTRIDGVNHLFQKAETGNPDEYGTITETMNLTPMQIITDWINK